MNCDKDSATNKIEGTTWFLITFYSITVECSSIPTIINWDRRKQYHDSCTLNNGGNVYSLFNCAFSDVKQQKDILRSFNKEQIFKKYKEGDEVLIRIRQRKMKHYKLKRQDYFLYDKRWSIFIAIVDRVEKHGKVFLHLKYSKLKLGTFQNAISSREII